MTTEKNIIKSCLNGEAQGHKALFEMFYGKMMLVCLRYASDKDEAKDLLQEGFMKVFKNLPSYKQEGSFEGWIRRIMVHNAINAYHQNKKFYQNFSLDDNDLPDFEVTSEDVLDKISYDELLNLVQTLSPAYKAVFNLYAIEGYSHKEIAELLLISEGTSKSNLAKARLKLQKQVIALLGVEIENRYAS